MKARLDERADLRRELQFLKECQFKYFSLAVTVSGIIMGVADKFGDPTKDDRGILLAPLLVVLPCWFIFFDKATTITRMVAYLTFLERAINQKNSTPYIGWENAISLYRSDAAQKQVLDRILTYWFGVYRGVLSLLAFRSANRYWLVSWLTFYGLGAASLWLNKAATASALFLFSGGLFAAIAISTFLLLAQLVGGSYSYIESARNWERVFTTAAAVELTAESDHLDEDG